MDENKFQEIKKSIEPFIVRKGDKEWKRFWYKYGTDISGQLTKQGQDKWLESKKAIRIEKLGKGYVISVLQNNLGHTTYKSLVNDLRLFSETKFFKKSKLVK